MHNPKGKKKGPPGRKASSSFGYTKKATSTSNNSSTTKDLVDDPYPQRLTNPLIENNSKSIQDIMNITDGIQFCQPDTFSLDYYSQFLGVPLQNNVPPSHLIVENPPVPRDAVYDVPRLGSYNRNVLFWTPDDDDTPIFRDTPDDLDPLYVSLYENKPTSVRVAASSTQHAKYLNYKTILETVKGVDTLPERWNKYTIQPVATFRQNHPDIVMTFEHGWIATQIHDNTVVGCIDLQLEWYREADEHRDDSQLIGVIRSIKLNEAVTDLAWLRTVLVCLVTTQLRNCCVNYALNNTVLPGFRMTPSAKKEYWMLDVHKFSTKFALMTYQTATSTQDTALRNKQPATTERWLVNLPCSEEVQACLTEHDSAAVQTSPSRQLERRNSSKIYSDIEDLSSCKSFRLLYNTETRELHKVEQDRSLTAYSIPTFCTEPPSIGILRNFTLPSINGSSIHSFGGDPLLDELVTKQKELENVEKGLQPKLRSLMETIIQNRVHFESQESVDRRSEEHRILDQARIMLDTRRELDVARQNKLLQDMDAVCSICTDGEVTPENQILFCESCNVAVHQMCYGIDRVPEGDYYCLACRRLGKDKIQSRVPPHLRVPLKLGICCELCPLKTGAFIRTDVPKQTEDEPDKFVHVVCRKWMGLSHIDSSTVEDVTETKVAFRRHRIRCDLCHGERGGMVKCKSNERCNKWFHVTCARAIGTMKIIHGENCHGDIEEDGWSLWCPEHSNLPPRARQITKHTLSQEKLIEYAKEFPPDPKPPLEHRPFNQLDGLDRAELLADPEYEKPLISELLNKRMYGMRCEVCNSNDEDTRNLTRCAVCSLVFCASCTLPGDNVSKQNYRCPACRFVEGEKKAGEDCETPQCLCCYQKGGFLGEAFARPITKTYWKKNKEEYKRSVFGRRTWVHALCAYWHPLIDVQLNGRISLTNVVLSDGRGQMINKDQLCFLCGQTGGIKMSCDMAGCCQYGVTQEERQKSQPLVMHATCARQAGLEVRLDDSSDDIYCYVRCYRHGGNEFNLRAQLEDLIEIEKKRAGKDHSRANLPMKFSDGSRLLIAAIQVMRTLGWAWRWAEWWVDYCSSWEPLLEPGQIEENMTKEELKIVESTRESRCDDARRCRLAAFGAALRNRAYDTEDGFNNGALERALRAILNTKSLVGPLQQVEEDFFVDWLARAYRSKSRLLYYGEDRNDISSKAPFTIHSKDKTPKFELGSRSIPGGQELDNGQVFEENISEVDDFLLFPIVADKSTKRRGRLRKSESVEEKTDDTDIDAPRWKLNGWKKPGRRKTNTSPPLPSTQKRPRDNRQPAFIKKRHERPLKRSVKRRKTSNGPERRTVSSKVDLRRIGGSISTIVDIVASAFCDSDFSGDESGMETAGDSIEIHGEKEAAVDKSQTSGTEQAEQTDAMAEAASQSDTAGAPEKIEEKPHDAERKDRDASSPTKADDLHTTKAQSSAKLEPRDEEDRSADGLVAMQKEKEEEQPTEQGEQYPVRASSRVEQSINDAEGNDDIPIADLVGNMKPALRKKKPRRADQRAALPTEKP